MMELQLGNRFYSAGICLKEVMSESAGICSSTDSEENVSVRKWQIVCGTCSQVITGDSERISVNGSHQHTFVNPQGIMFQIGCFAVASGCSQTGAATEQWSWFKGYCWRIVCCSRCGMHLGWVYLSTGEVRFYGFILNRLSRLN